MKKTIILIASSSGGHVYPIMGLYELLKEDYEIKFVGIKGKFEEKLYPENSLFLSIPSSFKALKKVKDKQKIKEEITKLTNYTSSSALIISGGGFASYLLTKIKHKNIVLLEQNRIMGDANFLLSFKAKKILSNMDILFNPFFYKTNIIISPSIFRIKEIHVEKENTIIFIFGSLSSLTLINKTLEYFLSKEFISDYTYELVVGNFYNKINKLRLPKNVKIIKEIKDINYLKKAKLIFSRAGGTSINEFLNFRIDFVMIPSPYVKHNHQEKNAQYYHKKYQIPLILEKDFNPTSIANTIKNYKGYKYIIKNENYQKIIKGIIDECI